MIQAAAMRAVPWRKLAVVGAGVALFAGGWTANGWRKDAEIGELTATSAQADLASANQALGDLRAASTTIRTKADEFAGIQTTLGVKLDAIRRDLKNAPQLPADCRPDDFRMRLLSDAVEAAKQAAAAR